MCMERDRESVRGLKLSSINRWLIALTCLLTAGMFILSSSLLGRYSEMTELTSEYLRLDEQADTVKEASDYLTNAVHEFVVTGDLQHLEAYFEEANVAQRRDNALNELSKQKDVSYEDVKLAVDESRELMKREIYAMALVSFAMTVS